MMKEVHENVNVEMVHQINCVVHPELGFVLGTVLVEECSGIVLGQ